MTNFKYSRLAITADGRKILEEHVNLRTSQTGDIVDDGPYFIGNFWISTRKDALEVINKWNAQGALHTKENFPHYIYYLEN